jgi:DNA-directed RNA polymerase subunit RPC12/RpoP
MKCYAKHAKYNPMGEDWKCPKCGSDDEYFIIDEPANDSAEGCELLHDNDELVCSFCGFYSSGKQFSDSLMKSKNLIACPHCKGKGWIPK